MMLYNIKWLEEGLGYVRLQIIPAKMQQFDGCAQQEYCSKWLRVVYLNDHLAHFPQSRASNVEGPQATWDQLLPTKGCQTLLGPLAAAPNHCDVHLYIHTYREREGEQLRSEWGRWARRSGNDVYGFDFLQVNGKGSRNNYSASHSVWFNTHYQASW